MGLNTKIKERKQRKKSKKTDESYKAQSSLFSVLAYVSNLINFSFLFSAFFLMAKTGVLETIPSAVTKATELKKELERLVKAILDDDDYKVEIIDEVMRILSALKELKFNTSSKSLMLVDDTVVPEEFKCPISRKLMADPVVLATGQVRALVCVHTLY